jgi:hypothetical protein
VVFYGDYSRSWQELLTFLSLGERVAACSDRACASVSRSDRGSESNYGLSSFMGWCFLRINFADELAFTYCVLVKLVRRSWQELPVFFGSWSQSLRSDGARASVRCGPREWKQPPGWIPAEDREVLPLPPFVPIAFWHKGMGLGGHAVGASRLPGVFEVFLARSSVLVRWGCCKKEMRQTRRTSPRISSSTRSENWT